MVVQFSPVKFLSNSNLDSITTVKTLKYIKQTNVQVPQKWGFSNMIAVEIKEVACTGYLKEEQWTWLTLPYDDMMISIEPFY